MSFIHLSVKLYRISRCVYPFWKDSINFSILSSLICSFLSTHFNPNNLNFFVYLFDCQVSSANLSVCRSTSCCWSVWMDSNHRPRAYQARALATWATDRFTQRLIRFAPSSRLYLDGGDEGIRTLDPLLAGQVLSQLSYTPIFVGLFSQTSIEAWQLNNRLDQYSRIHITVKVFA